MPEDIAELLAHIAQNGPVRSADFEHPRKGASGWWEWKPHKRHLEGLFTAGEVMVVERRNFQRVYDLTQRVMPHWDDERDALPATQAEAIMLRNSARSLGIFRPQWLADYYRLRQPALPGCWRPGRKRAWWCRLTWKRWARCGCIATRWRSWSQRPAVNSPPAIAPCSRLSTRWSGIGNALSNCSTSAIAWSAIPRAEASVWLLRTAAAAPGKTGRADGQQNASQSRELEIFALWLEEG
jgi:hypothetical protein